MPLCLYVAGIFALIASKLDYFPICQLYILLVSLAEFDDWEYTIGCWGVTCEPFPPLSI